MKCYVYLSDVSSDDHYQKGLPGLLWEPALRRSRWFTRGWTLQELLAPAKVEFFSCEGMRLGDKSSLESQIYEITSIPIEALRGKPLFHFSVEERFSWAKNRQTTRKEDEAYALLGVFDIQMALLYGEGREKAISRLKRKVNKTLTKPYPLHDPREGFGLFAQGMPMPALVDWGSDASLEKNQQSPVDTIQQNQREQGTPRRLNTPINRLYKHSTQEQAFGFMKHLVDLTQRAIVLGDASLHRHLAHIWRELGINHKQLEQLAQISRAEEFSRGDQPPTSSTSDTSPDNTSYKDIRPSSEQSLHKDSEVSNIFFKCASRYSEDHTISALQRSVSDFSGPPIYFLEKGSRFFPEQFSVAGNLAGTTYIVAKIELGYTPTYMLHKCFFFHCDTARHWRSVTVSATILTASKNSSFRCLTSVPNVEAGSDVFLPGDMQRQLEEILNNRRLFETVTRISLISTEVIPGKLIIDVENLSITEDIEQVRLSSTDKMIQDIEDMGCAKYVQSEVIVRSRRFSYTYLVQVGSQVYVERRLPFVEAGLLGGDGVSDFLNDIKTAHSLRDCSRVARFAGVVLDDTRKRVKSYLTEWPVLGSIQQFLSQSDARGEPVPWVVRDMWARQITTAVSEVHSKGIVIGSLRLNSILIQSDGNAILHVPGGSGRRYNYQGHLAPELLSRPLNVPLPTSINFRSDIFQLGLVLWMLTENTASFSTTYLCRRQRCTAVPCNIWHTNPIELPPFNSTEVPEYMNIIISFCRQRDPRMRLPARDLLKYFPDRHPPPQITNLASQYQSTDAPHLETCCNGCGVRATYLHYHCNICDQDNFDLCHECISKGAHCRVKEHILIKRTWRDGGLVVVSS